MEFDHNNVMRVVKEDRLSSLPDELIHKIMSCFDMKFAVQTCLLSSKWKLLWTTMPCLDISTCHYNGDLYKFNKFVPNLLSHRNPQANLFSIKVDLCGIKNHILLEQIARYAFSHNVQQLTVVHCPETKTSECNGVPSFLLSSPSLKYLTFICNFNIPLYITPKREWNFPALTTLHLRGISLCDDNATERVNVFSKCVNLKNLTLKCFLMIKSVGVFDIVTPQLLNLVLIDGICSKVINVIAPQLENLTVIRCTIKYLNTPPGLSSLCYKGYSPPQLSIDRFQSLKRVNIFLSLYRSNMPYEKEVALETISMLQKLHSAKYLTLNWDIVECISAFQDLLSHHSSPFSNLICLTIDYKMRTDAYKEKMSTKAKNFFLEKSPSATLIMELPKGR